MKKEIKVQGLCFRCEHRALNLETKGQHQPRCECGMKDYNVCGCYMYKPTRPVVTTVLEGYEKHPRFGPAMIAARERGCEILDGQLKLKMIDDKKACLYWIPKRKRAKRKTQRRR